MEESVTVSVGIESLVMLRLVGSSAVGPLVVDSSVVGSRVVDSSMVVDSAVVCPSVAIVEVGGGVIGHGGGVGSIEGQSDVTIL